MLPQPQSDTVAVREYCPVRISPSSDDTCHPSDTVAVREYCPVRISPSSDDTCHLQYRNPAVTLRQERVTPKVAKIIANCRPLPPKRVGSKLENSRREKVPR